MKDVVALDCAKDPPMWVDIKPVEIDKFIQRSQHTTVEYKNSLYVFGGHDGQKGTSLQKQKSTFMELSNEEGTVWQWRCVKGYNSKHEPAERYGHAAALKGSKMYVFGGYLALQNTWNRDLFRYDFTETKWEKIEVDETSVPRGEGSVSMYPWPDASLYLKGMHSKKKAKTQIYEQIIVVDGTFNITVLETGKKPVWRKVISPARPADDAFRENYSGFIAPIHGSDGCGQALICLMGGQGRGSADTLKQDLFQIVTSVTRENSHKHQWNRRTAGGLLPDNRRSHTMTLAQRYKTDTTAGFGEVQNISKGQKDGQPMIFMFGGYGPKGCLDDIFTLTLDNDYMYKKQKYSTHEKLMDQRLMRATMIAPNKIFTCGGYTISSDIQLEDQMLVYDSDDQAWTASIIEESKGSKSPMFADDRLISRVGHTLTADGNGNAIFFGGGCHQSKRVTNDFYLFNSSTNTWSEIAAVGKPPPRAGHTACMLDESLLVIIGGFQKIEHEDAAADADEEVTLGTYSNDVWVYDYKGKKTWQCIYENAETIDPKSPYMRPSMGHTSCPFGTDTIYTFGGSYDGVPSNDMYVMLISPNFGESANLYDIRSKRIKSHGQAPAPRTGHSATITQNRYYNSYMYISGGRVLPERSDGVAVRNKAGDVLTEKTNDMYIYDINNAAWSCPNVVNVFSHFPTYMGVMIPFDNSILVFSYDKAGDADLVLLKLEQMAEGPIEEAPGTARPMTIAGDKKVPAVPKINSLFGSGSKRSPDGQKSMAEDNGDVVGSMAPRGKGTSRNQMEKRTKAHPTDLGISSKLENDKEEHGGDENTSDEEKEEDPEEAWSSEDGKSAESSGFDDY